MTSLAQILAHKDSPARIFSKLRGNAVADGSVSKTAARGSIPRCPVPLIKEKSREQGKTGRSVVFAGTSIDVNERHRLRQLLPKTCPKIVLAATCFAFLMPSSALAAYPPQERIGIPSGETFTIISPKPARRKCRAVFSWGRPPKVVKRCTRRGQ